MSFEALACIPSLTGPAKVCWSGSDANRRFGLPVSLPAGYGHCNAVSDADSRPLQRGQRCRLAATATRSAMPTRGYCNAVSDADSRPLQRGQRCRLAATATRSAMPTRGYCNAASATTRGHCNAASARRTRTRRSGRSLPPAAPTRRSRGTPSSRRPGAVSRAAASGATARFTPDWIWFSAVSQYTARLRAASCSVPSVRPRTSSARVRVASSFGGRRARAPSIAASQPWRIAAGRSPFSRDSSGPLERRATCASELRSAS